MENHGLIDIGRRPRDFIGNDLPFEIRVSDGNWEPYLPDGEFQNFVTFDTMACVSFSLLNCIETQEFYLTGKRPNYSDRWLALMSGTTHQGNSLQIVADTVRKYGLVKEESWPAGATTWDEYYQVPDAVKMAELKAEGKTWLKTHNFDYAWLDNFPESLIKHLQHTPLQVVKPGHAIESFVFNKPDDVVKYFDTYKPFKKSIARSGLLDVLKPLLTIKQMSNAVFVHKVGTPEYGFFLPATTIESLRDKALNLGIDILKPDGTVDLSIAKDVSGL